MHFFLCMCAVMIMGEKHFDDSMHVHKQRLCKTIHVQMFTHRKKNRQSERFDLTFKYLDNNRIHRNMLISSFKVLLTVYIFT